MNTSQEILTKSLLSSYESEIYTLLVELGESLVPTILKHTRMSRATVYEALEGLRGKNLVDYRKEGRSAYYAPAHPSKLLRLMDDKKKEINSLEEEVKLTVESLVASYNITNKKPGVRFYIGDEMAEKIFLENLQAKETVYSITNRDDFETYGLDLLNKYIVEREKSNICEHVIVTDSPSGRKLAEYSKTDPTIEVKILPPSATAFSAGMDMYDGKIIYGTLKSKEVITVVIEDPEFCKMQRNIFEVLWSLL
jgi:sugar-specific transcriptional regulator TrmB